MPPPQYTITPWRDTAELLSVRTSLYNPTNPTDHASGIAHTQAWKLRGNLPHAVESTGLLFSAAKFHNATIERHSRAKNDSDASVADAFAVRATYTLALSRFVTGFADLGRHRTGAGQTMQDVARGIGLPSMFVEIRHEATHENIPALWRLQKMTTEALGWLWQTYWSRLDLVVDEDAGSAKPDAEMPAQDGRHIGSLREELKMFRSSRVAAIADKKASKSKGTLRKLVQRTADACTALVNDSDGRVEDLAKVLVVDRMIVPSKMDRFAIEAQAKGARLIWNELLLALVQRIPDLMHQILDMAVEQMSSLESVDESDPRVMFESWVSDFCSAQSWHEVVPSTDAIRWTLSACCLYPSPMSSRMATNLLSLPDISGTDIALTWRPLLEASTITGDGSLAADEDVHMENESDESIESEIRRDGDLDDLEFHAPGWRLDDSPWQPVPIGVVA